MDGTKILIDAAEYGELEAYRATGHTPGECTVAFEEVDQATKFLQAKIERAERMAKDLNVIYKQMQEITAELAAYRATGHTPEECTAAFEELAAYRAAEQDGTLLRTQCKKGDHVRATVIRPYNGHELTIFGDVVDVQVVFRVSHSVCRYTDFLNSDFGKTVFFAPEAAVAALKEQEESTWKD